MVNIPPSHELYHSRLQCDGAKRGLNGLSKRIARYKSNPLRISTKNYDGEIEFKWPALVPDSWSAIVSEIAHGLRASLNYVVWQLAVKNLGGVRKPSRQTQFPICDSPGNSSGGFKYQLSKQVADVLPSAITDIEYFQPYHRPDRPETHLLAVLRELSNSTNHQFLIQPQGGAVVILDARRGTGHIGVSLDKRNPRMILTITDEYGITKELNPPVTFQISIQVPTLTPTYYDISVLNGIYDLIRNNILPRFSGYF